MSAEQSRISRGQCPRCGIQTHEIKPSAGCGGLCCRSRGKSFLPLTNEDVRRGRCLQCNSNSQSSSLDRGADETLAQRVRGQPRWLIFLEVLTMVVTIVGLPVAMYEAFKRDGNGGASIGGVAVEDQAGENSSFQPPLVGDDETTPVPSPPMTNAPSSIIPYPITLAPAINQPTVQQVISPPLTPIPTNQPTAQQVVSPSLTPIPTNQPTQIPPSSSPPTNNAPIPVPVPVPAPVPVDPVGETTDNAITCISSVKFMGGLFEDDCNNCQPDLARDQDSVLVSKEGDGIQFLSKTAGNTFQAVTAFGRENFNVGDVAISGNVAVVMGIENFDTTPKNAAYLYEKDSSGLSWIQTQRIQFPEDASSSDCEVGFSVDVDGDWMVVGFPCYGGGSAFIYRRTDETTWVQEANLALLDGSKSDHFGASVSIKGNRVVVADSSYDTGNGVTGNDGAVFVYYKSDSSNEWTQQVDSSPLTNNDCDYSFGSGATLIDDNGLIVGCPGYDSSRGAVYYYESSSTDIGKYNLKQKITASDGASSDVFASDGDEITVDGNVMAVSTADQNDGKVYVYIKNNGVWTEEAMIETPLGKSKYFGSTVALVGKEILISSRINIYSYEIEECGGEV